MANAWKPEQWRADGVYFCLQLCGCGVGRGMHVHACKLMHELPLSMCMPLPLLKLSSQVLLTPIRTFKEV